MKCNSYDACVHETRTDLCFEAKQIQFALEFRHIIRKKCVLLRIRKYDLLIFMKNGTREANPDNRGRLYSSDSHYARECVCVFWVYVTC